MLAMILNECSADTKEECLLQTSSYKKETQDWRCCWVERRIKGSRDENWSTYQRCKNIEYDGDLISLSLKIEKAEIKFYGGEIDYSSIDCSSRWIHSFFGLVLLLAFIL
jgi:hypothetical protein